MSARVNLSFIFIIIKNYKKSIYYNEIFKFFDIITKLKIKIIIYDIKLIFNENHLYIFN